MSKESQLRKTANSDQGYKNERKGEDKLFHPSLVPQVVPWVSRAVHCHFNPEDYWATKVHPLLSLSTKKEKLVITQENLNSQRRLCFAASSSPALKRKELRLSLLPWGWGWGSPSAYWVSEHLFQSLALVLPLQTVDTYYIHWTISCDPNHQSSLLHLVLL